MSDPKTSLSENFALLKMTAVCVEDIAEWFKANPAFVPDMPEMFRENAQVKISATRTMLDPNLEPPGVLTYLTLTVDVRVEPSRDKAITDDDFEHSTGQVIRIQRSRVDAAWYAGEFVLPLLAMEWPMIAAQQAHFALTKELATDDTWYAHARQSWEANFTNITWDTLVNLHSSGILPLVEEEFISWAVKSTGLPNNGLGLPMDFDEA